MSFEEAQAVAPAPVKSVLPEIMMAVVITVLLLVLVVIFLRFLRRLVKRVGRQKFILLCGVLILVLCGLFPPWQYTADHNGNGGFHARKSAGYSLIVCPPAPEHSGVAFGVQLDFGRLFLEWAALAAVTGMGWLLFVKRPTTPPATGNPKN
jgi:hypothetical protein